MLNEESKVLNEGDRIHISLLNSSEQADIALCTLCSLSASDNGWNVKILTFTIKCTRTLGTLILGVKPHFCAFACVAFKDKWVEWTF